MLASKIKFINNIWAQVQMRPKATMKIFGGFHPQAHLLLYAERTVLRFFETMLAASKYTKMFTSDELTRQKYDELYSLAVAIREHKNRVSKEVCKDILCYLGMTPMTFVKEMRGKYKGAVNYSFDSHIYSLLSMPTRTSSMR